MRYLIIPVALLLAAAQIPGPLPAKVIRVIDGDSIEVRVDTWPRHYVEMTIRVDGVDTPEIRGKCQREKNLAAAAKAFVVATVGKTVKLENVREGKYAGRMVAKVLVGGKDLAEMLIAKGLGRPYGGGKRKGWCGVEK